MSKHSEKRKVFGPNKYSAFHLLLCRWLRHFAQKGPHCYVTLGGTELRDVLSICFIDRDLASPALSFEKDSDSFALASETAQQLNQFNIKVEPKNIFDFQRTINGPHLFFWDFQGWFAWADYHLKFGRMLQRDVIKDGDALFITSYLGRHLGWEKIFRDFAGEFTVLGLSGQGQKRQWFRRAHPSFTLFKGLNECGLVNEVALKCIGCVEYRDKSSMAIYGYVVKTGRTVFVDFVKDQSSPFFQLGEGQPEYVGGSE